ncbi:hypothetical protein B296_00043721 [Ensete ventricosum]|uniref:Uncharacterized protein n=1 Tax=Ensete ventricosum TaxID=4639 RepID=A0A426ZDJ3_ENSVE|nr:hypothetical protein B296_00043721 [Ensete ventricosum]
MRYQPCCGEGRRSVKGEGRRRRRRSMRREKENRENLDAKPFLDFDSVPPSLDDSDPRGNGEVAARAAEEAVSFIASSTTSSLRFLSNAGDVCGLRHLHCLLRLMSQMRRRGEEKATSSMQRMPPY